MGHGFIDHSCRLDSHVHRFDVRAKIVLAVFFIVLSVTTPPKHLLTFLTYAGVLLWAIALSRVPLGPIAARSATVLPFSVFLAVGLPFIKGGETIQICGLALSLSGLWLFIGATIKSLLSVVALILLVSTTPFNRILNGLRQLGMPTFFIDLLTLTYRYLFLLVEEGTRLRRAAVARGYAPRWLPQTIIIGRLVGNLFLRSYERAERVYGAMRLRGYTGQLPISVSMPFQFPQLLVVIIIMLMLVTVRLFVK